LRLSQWSELRFEPLTRRRHEPEAALDLGEPPKQILLSRRLAQDGLSAYRIAKRRCLEGVVAKDSDAPYEEHRSGKWLKVKVHLHAKSRLRLTRVTNRAIDPFFTEGAYFQYVST
jgi:ATP-dependent DNA ligase